MNVYIATEEEKDCILGFEVMPWQKAYPKAAQLGEVSFLVHSTSLWMSVVILFKKRGEKWELYRRNSATTYGNKGRIGKITLRQPPI